MKVAPNIEYKFFNRNKEYDMIMDHLSGKPSKPLLLLGPINSGKTALLKSIIAKEKSRVLYLNCGVKDVSSPELMARQLRNLARKLPSRLGMQGMKTLASKLSSVSKLLALGDNVLDVAVPGEKVLNAFFEDFFPEDKANDLTAVIDTYDLLLENIPRGQNKPIIVIDEVNAMKSWRTEDEDCLSVVAEGLNGTQRKVDVLGDLTSAEAFVYVCGGKGRNKRGFEEDWPGLMSQSEQTLALGMTPEDWKKVWSVCGGNMYLLQNCVTEATRSSSWDKGVAETLSEPQKDVATALERPRRIPPPTDSSAPRSWESEHYKAVLRLIAANPYHAVRQEDAEAALRGVGIDKNVTADEVLLSMVEYNVVSLRPYSDMARDIPREAFFKMEWGVEDEEDVVTMPSPAHLAAALLLETKFQKQDEAEGVKMFSISRRLGPALLRRSTATAATANKAHADPATWAVNYNPQERDRIDNNINANRDLIHENHKYMNERFDDHRQQMDGKLDEKLKHVDTKLDSALEKFIKSNDSLKVSFTELRDELSKMKAETKDELSKMKAETKEDFHKLDKSVTLVSRSAALLASAISLGLTFA
ncbi:hypothetical protein KSW81_000795 [Nannochloris sp. 'desiccata']|nr:hypothetical protein KSW81_000795 [Chlorella desiccata (nom. nud.)]